MLSDLLGSVVNNRNTRIGLFRSRMARPAESSGDEVFWLLRTTFPVSNAVCFITCCSDHLGFRD